MTGPGRDGPAALLGLLGLLGCSTPAGPPPRDASVGDVGPFLDIASAADTAPAPPPPPPPSEPGRHAVTVEETRQVVPGPGLPPMAMAGTSNNNLDVVRHGGRVYLAWRTAPDHFASNRTEIFVVSSPDEVAWTFEARFAAETDLREPRLLSFHGALTLYLARLGTDPLGFDPQGMSRSTRGEDGQWSALTPFYRPGFIPWRTRVEAGRAYMTAYLGGENIYRFNGLPLQVELLGSDDGQTWAPVDPARPVVYEGGGSETDFTLGPDGTLFAVIRNEAGDASGWGSLVCRAPAGDLARWTCRHDPRKYDSPLMFWQDGEAYLVGRRHVTEDGRYDLGQRSRPHAAQSVAYQAAYAIRPKRCSLWRYVQAEDRIAYLLDLPSQGDTCFAGILDGPTPDTRVIYNYSSPLDGPDLPWNRAQHGPTRIYRHVLRFAPRP